MAYFVFYIFVIITLYIESRCKRANSLLRLSIAIVYSLFLGLRGANVGVDTPVYYRHFYFFGQYGCDFVEPGFDWIVRFYYAQGWECWTMFLTCASLAIYFFHIGLNRLPRKIYTVTAAMFYILSFALLANGMRQVVVCGVFFYAMSFFYGGYKGKKYVLLYISLLLLSSLMHASALLLSPLFLLYKLRLKKKIYLIIYLCSFIFLFVDFSDMVPVLVLLGRDYGRYLTEDEDVVQHASLLGFVVTTFANILIFWVMYKMDSFRKSNTLANLVVISFVLKNAAFYIPMMNRVSIYFSWFVYVMVAYLYVTRNKKYGFIFIIVFAIYGAVLVNGVFSSANNLLPYKTYWENYNYELLIDEDEQ